jgi:bifunctional DNA-binding transcriptional regulator/antitoxin component of YhaV-PrlF toxin-antitoxin module
MVEVLDETKIRERNEITIPMNVRSFLKLVPGDFIRWELSDLGCIIVCKAVIRKVNNRCCKNIEGGVGENGEKGSG